MPDFVYSPTILLEPFNCLFSNELIIAMVFIISLSLKEFLRNLRPKQHNTVFTKQNDLSHFTFNQSLPPTQRPIQRRVLSKHRGNIKMGIAMVKSGEK